MLLQMASCHSFFPHGMGDLPQPGIQHVPPALEVQSFNHWTTREVHFTLCYGLGISLHIGSTSSLSILMMMDF